MAMRDGGRVVRTSGVLAWVTAATVGLGGRV